MLISAMLRMLMSVIDVRLLTWSMMLFRADVGVEADADIAENTDDGGAVNLDTDNADADDFIFLLFVLIFGRFDSPTCKKPSGARVCPCIKG